MTVLTSPVSVVANSTVQNFYFAALTAYSLTVVFGAIDIAKKSDLPTAAGAILYTIPTHLYYGLQFIRGFIMTGKLNSALR